MKSPSAGSVQNSPSARNKQRKVTQTINARKPSGKKWQRQEKSVETISDSEDDIEVVNQPRSSTGSRKPCKGDDDDDDDDENGNRRKNDEAGVTDPITKSEAQAKLSAKLVC